MNNNQDHEIEIKLKNNEIKKGKIIFTFEANGDNFIIYELDDKAYAAKINEDNSLRQVEKDEWKLVQKTYDAFIDQQEKNEGDN